MNLPESFPLHLWPSRVQIRHDQLCLGEHRLGQLADQWGTPLYIYDAATFHHAVRAYRLGLRAWPGESRLAYAAKAWFNLPFAQVLSQCGLDLDLVSAGEMGIARTACFQPQAVHLHGNNKTARLLEMAAEWGINAIVVDNLHELSLLEELASAGSRVPNLWLRLNPDILAATHPYQQTGQSGSKFGLNEQEAMEAAKRIHQHPHLHLTGLHAHIGSQIFALESWWLAIQHLSRMAAMVHRTGLATIQTICPGGGLGVPYHPDDPQLPLAQVVEQIADYSAHTWQDLTQQPHPTLVLEPGRSLIARAGVALYRVGSIRHLADGTRIIATDGSMADNPRPALYGARYTACLARHPLAPPVGPARIVGPLCESGDYLIASINLPELVAGDVLAIPMAGAYQLSMASQYNATLSPPAYWFEENQWTCFQRRQTLADLIQRDISLTEVPRSSITNERNRPTP